MTKHAASNKQLALIASLVTQIQALAGPSHSAELAAEANHGHDTASASNLIDRLFNELRTAKRQARVAQATPELEAIDHGFHQVTVDGVTKILKVKHPKTGGRPYAYGVKAEWPEALWGDDLYTSSKWFYLGRQFNDLLSKATLLDATQAAAFGHKHGWCIVCSAKLEDPESVYDGIGPSCYKTITGETKAQARKAGHLAQLPAVVAAEVKARKAAQRVNRAAEKRALAEVA